jgi:integrase
MLKGMPLSPRARTPPVAAKGTLRKIRSAGPEWKAWVTTALKTGLRVGELLALTWEDVDLVAGRLVVRRTPANQGARWSGKRDLKRYEQ